VYGYGFVAFSSLAIAVLGFLVWGHHMFVAGESVYAALIFSALSFLVAIPSAVKVFNWTATMYKGSISWDTPMLYALGFIGLFTIGGLTGLYLAALASDLKPGKLQRYDLLGEPVLLGRDRKGQVYGLRDICPHRAAPLSAGKLTSEPDGSPSVECPYHGWRFRTDGVCAAQPISGTRPRNERHCAIIAIPRATFAAGR